MMASSSQKPKATGKGQNAASGDGNRPLKRRKTTTACVHCRNHKLRCDFENAVKNEEDGRLICKHCADFGIECIVVPPANARAGRTSLENASGSAYGNSTSGSPLVKEVSDAASAAAAISTSSNASAWQTDDRALDDPRYSGESSLSALVSHFVFIITGRDQQQRQVHTHLTTEGAQPSGTDDFLLLPQTRYPAPLDGTEARLVNASIDRKTIDMLIDRYLTFIYPLNAILSRREVLDSIDTTSKEVHVGSISAVGLAVLCVSAMYRATPRYARDALLFHQRHRRMSIFRSSVETVQSLVVLSLSVEMMAPDTNDAAGMCLNMLGLAIRMAQDLGMHRNLQENGISPTRTRRYARIWSALITQDRWYSLCYGQPNLIQMDDCDTPPPSVYDDEQDPATVTAATPAPYTMHVAHYEVALLVGRIHKLAFGPLGLRPSSHQLLRELIDDLNTCFARLPPHLDYERMKEAASMPNASFTVASELGWFFSMRMTIEYLIYRVALNLAPKDMPFDRDQQWKSLVRRSSEALEWLSSFEGLHCLDSYSITMYFLVQCSIVQYYAACQGESLHGLRVARQSMQSKGSVATVYSSRSQLYDPYGPTEEQHQQRQMQQNLASRSQPGSHTTASNGQTSSNGASVGQQASDSSSGRSSPVRDNGGPPRMIRLRTKVASLLSMLLEIAESRRAVVLSARENMHDTRRSNGTAKGGPAKMEAVELSRPVVDPYAASPNYAARSLPGQQAYAGHASASHIASQPRLHQPVQHFPPPFHAAAKHDLATSSPASAAASLGSGGGGGSTASYAPYNGNDMSSSVPGVYSSSPQLGFDPRSSVPDGASAANGAGSQNAQQSPHHHYQAAQDYHHPHQYPQQPPHQLPHPHHTANAAQDMHIRAPATSAMGAHPPALMPPYAAHSADGHSDGPGHHGPPQPPAFGPPALTPRNIEDMDLVTIQRWADAVLLKPAGSAIDQHQAIPTTTML